MAKDISDNSELSDDLRRQVQEQNKELRGANYKGRQTTMQNKWLNNLGYETNK